ncbi:MAG: SPOR domain-containing protein [Treponema sp.]|nr:SPOR domain-containing protein [Treponema sp.]
MFFTFLLVRGVALLYGQSPGGLSFAAAIGDIEALLGKSGVSGAERHGALERLARLYQLSGNIEEAARAWTDAAFAEPGKRDDNALLEGAGCYLALGETEKAQASVQTVLLTGRDPGALFKARYLGAQLAAFRFSDTSALITLIDDPDYGKLKPAVYYTLWKISGAETYKNRLLAEYPLSPEARILEEQGIVTADPIALWIFFPGREGIIAGEPVQISSSSSGEKPAAPETGESAAVLQTGLFSREGNARTMVERLKSAGFEPQVARRALRGTDYWAVTVPPGPDINKTILELKNAGFESFPVY